MVFVRAAELTDTPYLKNLFQQLGYQTNADDIKQRINEKNENLNILVAELAEEVCGVIVMSAIWPVHENNQWAIISALVIDESSRGEGIGQKLLLACERIAAEKKCSRIELSSSEKRVRAHNFYQNNGYQEVRKRFVKYLNNSASA